MGLVRDLLPGYAESIHDARNEVVLFEKLPRISLYSGLLEKSDNIMAVQLE